MLERTHGDRRPAHAKGLARWGNDSSGKTDRAHGRKHAAIGGVANGVEESIELWLGSRGVVQGAVVFGEGSVDW